MTFQDVVIECCKNKELVKFNPNENMSENY